MAWCCQATSHYMSQCWPTFMMPYSKLLSNCAHATTALQYVICNILQRSDHLNLDKHEIRFTLNLNYNGNMSVKGLVIYKTLLWFMMSKSCWRQCVSGLVFMETNISHIKHKKTCHTNPVQRIGSRIKCKKTCQYKETINESSRSSNFFETL